MVQMLQGMKSIAWVVLAGLMLAVSGCDEFEGKTVLAWTDPESGTQVEVKAAERGGAMRVHMQVRRGERENRLVLYDKAELHLVSLLHYNDWVLVLSGPYVLGGYDIKGDRIVPYNSDELPFTYHTLDGFPIVEKRLADGDDPVPFEFRRRDDRPR